LTQSEARRARPEPVRNNALRGSSKLHD
jgi:hypothetical protein